MTATPHRSRVSLLLMGAALVVAVFLPPTATAEWLRTPGDPMIPQLATGFWLLKGLIALHVVAAIVLRRLLPEDEPAKLGVRRGLLAVASLLIVGLLLRLPGLNHGLWFDEIQTLIESVRLPWGTVLTTFDSTNQHMLYSIAARAVISMAGESAAALRLPSLVFGVMSLWAAVAFGRRWLPTREVWWAAAVLAVSYHHIWFSQNARGYTGLLLGTIVGSTLFLDLMREESSSRRRVWMYALVMGLTLFTHVTALVVVAGHGACWLLGVRALPPGVRRWVPFAGLVLSVSVALMLYAPILPQVAGALSAPGASEGVAWQNPLWFVRETLSGLSQGFPAGVVAVPIAAVIVIVGIVQSWKAHRDAVLVMLVPLTTMLVLLLATGHNLWPRFFFFGAAFVVQLAVHGGFVVLQRIVPRFATRVGDAGLAAVALGSLVLLPRAWAPKQDYEAAAAWVTERAQPGDAIAAIDMMRLPLVTWLGKPWPVVTDSIALHAVERDDATTWVLDAFPIRTSEKTPALWAYLQREYTTVHVVPATISGGEIVVLSKRAPVQP